MQAPQLWAALHLPALAPERLTQLACVALRFTPRVCLAPPDGLLLEVHGSLHLFAGLAGLRAQLLEACRQHSVEAVLAFAPTSLAALVAARAGRALAVRGLGELTGQLAELPLAVLRWPAETLLRLKGMGVRTIGAVLRLPRAGFARRFGAEALAMLDVLTGRAAEAQRSFQAPARFRRRRVLNYELESHGALLHALAPLLAELGGFLRTHQYGLTELECRFRHRHVPATRCVLRLAAPAQDVARLTALLGEHLSRLSLPEPVRECELRAAAFTAHQAGSLMLWQAREHGGRLGAEGSELIERLRARLGVEAVHGLIECDGHRPEKAWARSAPPAPGRALVPPRRPRRAPAPGAAAQRPLWLLREPRRLRLRDGRPCRRGPLTLVSEPERIESGWWDGEDVARDYYTAVDLHGVRLWVFRERLSPHRWFLHGVFG